MEREKLGWAGTSGLAGDGCWAAMLAGVAKTARLMVAAGLMMAANEGFSAYSLVGEANSVSYIFINGSYASRGVRIGSCNSAHDDGKGGWASCGS